MHTEMKDHYDCSVAAQFPPTPHFDSESIEQAKPVEPLRRIRFAKISRRGLQFGTAILVGLMFVVLEIATVARLNRQINAASATPEISNTVATTQATTSNDDSAAEVPSVAPINTATLGGKELRRGRIRRQVQPPRVFEFDQTPLTGKPKARLVTVFH
ncbi:MAG TPA: hypothetical protein VHP99_19330 [Pyrinomonadaceae bacterium]|nr:hypothetical protein [Pyrinomonadaceae bacterium]